MYLCKLGNCTWAKKVENHWHSISLMITVEFILSKCSATNIAVAFFFSKVLSCFFHNCALLCVLRRVSLHASFDNKGTFFLLFDRFW